MKKQILFLAMFVLALFAGNSNVFGQAYPYKKVPTAAPTCLTPTPFTAGVCAASELKPVQGEVYKYTVTTTAATDKVRWFVVNNKDLEAATPADSLVSKLVGILPTTNTLIDKTDGTGNYILNLGTTNNTYNTLGSDPSIQIAWKYFDGHLPNEVLLVAYVESSCTNNIAVYRIIPQPAFTIDIASINEAGSNPQGPGSATPNSECVSNIESALYTAADNTTPNKELTVDYGENWMFFVVNGANYIDSWMPQFQLSYAGGTAPVAEASWAYLADATDPASTKWNTLTGSGSLAAAATTWTSASPVIAGGSAATPGTVGAGKVPAAGGECIVVRVRLDWGTTIEHDNADGTLTFAADGIAYDGNNGSGGTFFDDVAFGDLHTGDCKTDGFTNDQVNYIITPRPKVEAGTPVQETKTGDTIN